MAADVEIPAVGILAVQWENHHYLEDILDLTDSWMAVVDTLTLDNQAVVDMLQKDMPAVQHSQLVVLL